MPRTDGHVGGSSFAESDRRRVEADTAYREKGGCSSGEVHVSASCLVSVCHGDALRQGRATRRATKAAHANSWRPMALRFGAENRLIVEGHLCSSKHQV